MLRLMLMISLLVLATGSALATNSATSIVLHGVEQFGGCTGYGEMDCSINHPSVVDITGFSTPAIYVFLYDYESVTGLQCAFDWPASWEFTFSLFACQPNQVNGTTPSASGSTTGTITTAFDVITGGEVKVIGTLSFGAAAAGCLQIIESSYPFATHVVNQVGEVTEVIDSQRGSICVGPGGCDACDHCHQPVEETSWSQIKRQYRDASW